MKYVLFGYLIISVYTVAHELAHAICAKAFGLNIIKIQLGSKLLCVEGRRLNISPILIGGYVEVAHTELLRLPKLKKIVYFEAGCLANIFIMILFATVLRGFLAYEHYFIAVCLIFANQIPVGKTDVSMLIQYNKKRTPPSITVPAGV
ncbi:MAG: M50 family metallopeptidase [Clostridiales bacterium]|nr:M50 family metallopeptidase [Candidatus Cacconaster stercorequi]